VKRKLFLFAAAALVAVPSIRADITITDSTGAFTVGIGHDGELFDYGSYTGFRRNADGYDPLEPGSPRDSWGSSTTLGAAYADQAAYGDVGVSSTITSTSSTATYTTTTTNGLSVTQHYAFLAPNILGVTATVTNTSGSATDVLWQRDVDWDVYPTEFDETSTGPPIAGAPKVIDSSYYGFENPNPATPYVYSCAAGCTSTGDNGGGIKLDLGMLGAGDSTTFEYLYGITDSGQRPAALLAEADSLGAYYSILSYSSDGTAATATNGAIISVAMPLVSAVPEPSAWVLGLSTIAGCMLVGWKRLRSRSA
jgi:hypothetical protein